jgi:hypothetical protein
VLLAILHAAHELLAGGYLNVVSLEPLDDGFGKRPGDFLALGVSRLADLEIEAHGLPGPEGRGAGVDLADGLLDFVALRTKGNQLEAAVPRGSHGRHEIFGEHPPGEEPAFALGLPNDLAKPAM